MGLDIYCKNEGERVGSYSYVHINRKDWIRASILYLENEIKKYKDDFLKDIPDEDFTIEKLQRDIEDEEDEDKKMKISQILDYMKIRKELENCLPKTEIDNFLNCMTIDYTLFEKLLESLAKINLPGLYWWVFHSDCEGILTPGQSFDIISSLKKIWKWMDKENFEVGENEERKYQDYYLYKIFQTSVDSDEGIVFC